MSNRINRWAIATAALLLALVQSQAAWAQDVATPYSDSTTPSATAAMPVAADSQVPADTGAMLAGSPGSGTPCPNGPLPVGPTTRCCMTRNCPPPCCPLPECPPPTLYARFRGMALMRDADEHVDFAALGITAEGESPDIVLNTNSVKFPFSGGGEILLGWMIVPSHSIEFSYFGLSSWNRSAAVRDNTANDVGGFGDLFSPFGAFGNTFAGTPLEQFDYNDLAAVEYRSRLNNFELNLRHQLPIPPIGLRTSFLFGGRAMQLDDDLQYRTTSDMPTLSGTRNTILTQTRNRLLGVQVGGLFEFHVDPGWWINFGMKGAICQNKIDLYSRYQAESGTGGTQTYFHSRSEGQTSFVGDLDLSLIYECSRCMTAEVGYRAIWITGLALGAENLQTNPELLTLGPLALDDKGQAVYHGPHVGVTVRW